MRYKDAGHGIPLVFVHGFGYSDKPKNYQYTIQNHQENFSKFIAHLNLEKFHLVVHDFGGIIALPYALQNLNSISSLVTWVRPMSKVEKLTPLTKKIMSSFIMKYLYLKMNFSAKFFVKLAWGQHSHFSKNQQAYPSF